MKIKKLISTLSGVALLMAAASAHASTTNIIGILDASPYSIANPYVSNASVQGSFLNTYNFSLNNTNLFTGSVSQLTLSMGASHVLNIDNLALKLFDGSNNQLANVTGAGQISSTLLSGSYHLNLSGIGSGAFGGNYTVAAVAQPVPEPDGWMLFLSGLAVTGFVAFRRRSFS